MDTDEHLEESCFIAVTEVASVPSWGGLAVTFKGFWRNLNEITGCHRDGGNGGSLF